jgi:intermediate peptidase
MCVYVIESVQSFLNGLALQHLPQAQHDLHILEQEKAHQSNTNKTAVLYAWDRDYYTYHARQQRLSSKRDHQNGQYENTEQGISLMTSFQAYTSIGRCIQGISRLLEALYGIRLEPAATTAGEIWHPSVRKLAVVDTVQGRIGTIYCDLADRPGKPSGAAHYTVRCARRVWPDELPAIPIPAENLVRRGDQMRQLPVVVLVCGFARETVGLSFYELETLFHEMGHAVHCRCIYPDVTTNTNYYIVNSDVRTN